LASDFIHEHELGPLLKKAEQQGVLLLWVPVRASRFEQTPLKDLQAVLPADKPLEKMKPADRNAAWIQVCDAIMKAVRSGLLGDDLEN